MLISHSKVLFFLQRFDLITNFVVFLLSVEIKVDLLVGFLKNKTHLFMPTKWNYCFLYLGVDTL